MRAVRTAVATALVATGLVAAAASPAAADDPPATFTIDGGGHGHGVGMPQHGAYGMAKAGFGYADILRKYYTGIAVGPASDPAVDVRLTLAGTNGQAQARLTAGAVPVDLHGAASVYRVEPGTTTTVTVSGGQLLFNGTPTGVGTLSARWAAPDPANRPATPPLRLAPSVRFGGSVDGDGLGLGWGSVTLAANGANVASTLVAGIDQLAYGLGEMPSSWHVEALKAQAVAARSYIRQKTTAAPDTVLRGHIDIAYTGWEKEVEGTSQSLGKRWTGAVDATAATYATYQGKAIQAFFMADSGGHTENSENVFVAALPYLKGVPDPYRSGTEPYFRWRRTYQRTDLQAWLGYAGTLTGLSIVGPFGVSGRPVDTAQSVVLTGSAGTKAMTVGAFRSAINANNAANTGKLLDSMISTSGFLAYAQGFEGGVNVAVGAVGSGGAPAIVTGADQGGGPHVRVFTAGGEPQGGGFFAYPGGFVGGVRVAVCRTRAGGPASIVTAPGPGGGPNVRVFPIGSAGTSPAPSSSFWAYDPGFTAGVYLACADLDHDGVDEIITGAGPGAGPNVRVFRPSGELLLSTFAYDPGFKGGVRVAGGDVGGTSQPGYFVVTPGSGGGPNVRVLSLGGQVVSSFWGFDPAYPGGAWVAVGDLVGADGTAEIVVGRGDLGGADVRVVDAGGRDRRAPLVGFSTGDDHGARVAVGALGSTPLVVGAGRGSAPHVRALAV